MPCIVGRSRRRNMPRTEHGAFGTVHPIESGDPTPPAPLSRVSHMGRPGGGNPPVGVADTRRGDYGVAVDVGGTAEGPLSSAAHGCAIAKTSAITTAISTTAKPIGMNTLRADRCSCAGGLTPGDACWFMMHLDVAGFLHLPLACAINRRLTILQASESPIRATGSTGARCAAG